jgi:hypothetical protein
VLLIEAEFSPITETFYPTFLWEEHLNIEKPPN